MLDEHMGPIKKYSILTVGAVVLALANYVFKFPNHFSFGGVAGFAVMECLAVLPVRTHL